MIWFLVTLGVMLGVTLLIFNDFDREPYDTSNIKEARRRDQSHHPLRQPPREGGDDGPEGTDGRRTPLQ